MPTALQQEQKKAAPQTDASHRPWWRSPAEAAAWLCLVIVAAELVFGIAGIGESEYLQPDRVCGVSAFPGKQVTWRKEGFSRVRFNSWGMQDNPRSLQKPPGVRRLVMAGDSFVEALQVERAKNMCSLLSCRLNQGTDRAGWEVLNWGVSSSNLGQIYLRLKRDIWRFSPDVVVVPVRADAVYELIPRNDGGFLSARPTFFIDSKGQLAQDDQIMQLWQRSSAGRRMRAAGWLRANSHVWGAVANMVEEFSGWLAQARAGSAWTADVTAKQTAFAPAKSASARAVQPVVSANDQAAVEHNKEVATRYYWPVADKLLQAMKSECDVHGCRLVVMRLPACPTWHNDVETKLLQATCANYGIDYCDTSERFAAEMRSSAQPMWFTTHFTERGHSVFSDELYRYLTTHQRVLFTEAPASQSWHP